MYHFLIIEKQPVIAAGIKSFLATGFPSAKIKDVQPNHINELSLKQEFDAYIFSIGLVVSDNDELIQNIFKHQSGARIIVFANEANTIFAKHYLRAGVKGYLSKNTTKNEFISAIAVVLDNKVYLSDDIKYALTSDFIENKTTNKLSILSKRELEVASMLAKGLSNNEICEITKLHSSSVGTYKARIFQKLNVKNIIELRHFATVNNLVSG